MEQYFEITKQSSRYKEYFDYLEADEACRKVVKEFIEEKMPDFEFEKEAGGVVAGVDEAGKQGKVWQSTEEGR